jgi:hypothetical protein
VLVRLFPFHKHSDCSVVLAGATLRYAELFHMRRSERSLALVGEMLLFVLTRLWVYTVPALYTRNAVICVPQKGETN